MKKTIACLLALSLLCVSLPAAAAAPDLAALTAETAQYLRGSVPAPTVGVTGGDWAVLGLSRSGIGVPDDYYRQYLLSVRDTLTARDGVLHRTTYTEYSRVILALSALGQDARSFAGYDLTRPLADFDAVLRQGLNGAAWALLALDCADYPMPEAPDAPVQATRQAYVDELVGNRLPEGGWSLSGRAPADPDVTGMILQALAPYREQTAVAAAIENALTRMSALQDADGGFVGWGGQNSESCVQMLIALCTLGVPLDDARFVKNGCTVLDALLRYRDGSAFRHTADGEGSRIGTEQALCGLAAALRAQQGLPALYDLRDARTVTLPEGAVGLPGKDAAVRPVPVSNPGKSFADVAGHPAQSAVETLAARGILNGKSAARFDPDAGMTRAEFAAAVVRALGLTPARSDAFSDVKAGKWYAPYIGTAHAFGIVNGVGGGRFRPNGGISRQEAAVMTARAAALCGMDTAYDRAAARDVLAQFDDYTRAASWARAGLAFCYEHRILDDSVLSIDPTAPVTRGEVAQMLAALLDRARLL